MENLTYFLYAFFAGLLTNIMPCSLIILLLKVNRVINNVDDDDNSIVCLGISTVYLLLSFVVIFAKYTGSIFGWGMHMQNKIFILFLVLLLFYMTLVGLDIKTIQKILRKRISLNLNSTKISVPGQFKIHYSPGIPIRLNVKKINKDEAYLMIKKKKKNKPNYFFLSKNGDLKESAKNLYSTLRKIKKNKYKSIAVSKIPNRGLGKTINDRLLRASKF